MKLRHGTYLFISALFFCWVAGSAVAAETKGAPPTDPALIEQIREANAGCIACHSEGGIKNPPRPGLDLAVLGTRPIDPSLYEHSNHAGMGCTACHGDGYQPYPHQAAGAAAGPAAQLTSCHECHAHKAQRIERQIRQSAHARTLADKFTCQSCHDPHVYKVAAKLGDPHQIVAQDNAMCLDCHDSEARYTPFVTGLTPARGRPDIDTVHDWLPNVRLHWQAVRCVDCHTPVSPIRSLGLSHEILPKERAEKNCVTCHTQRSALRTRLYRHLAEQEHRRLGFVNSVMLGSTYVVGATRNVYLDTVAVWLVALTGAGIAFHAVARIGFALSRRRRRRAS